MLGLSFLSPLFLIGAAAAAVPIFLHLFKRRVEPEVPFSAVRFLRRAPVEQSRRRRLRELLLLALRVSALVILATAFARPYLAGAAGAGAPITMVLVDTSYSMSAPGQFARAQLLARQAIDQTPLDRPVGVVAFSDDARVVSAPSAGRSAALAAVDALAPDFGGTRYRTALARAAEALGDAPGRLVVVTDLQQVGWESPDEGGVPERIAVSVVDAGARAANLAVIDLQRDSTGIVAFVRNTGASVRSARATMRIDERVVAESTLTVAGDATAEIRFTSALPRAGLLAVSIDDPLGYDADNRRFLLLDALAAAPLLVVTGSGSGAADAFYLDRALSLGESTAGFRSVFVDTDRLSSMTVDDLRPYGAVFLVSTRGLSREGRETPLAYVRGGGGLFVASGPDVAPDLLRDILGPAVSVEGARAADSDLTFAPSETRHPIFRALGAAAGNLGAVRFTRVAALGAPRDGRTLARFSSGAPALIEWTVGEGRVLLFASDLNNAWNNFPLQTTYVPFVIESVRYLAAAREQPAQYLIGDLPPGAERKPGLAMLPARGRDARPGARRRVAANVDPRESDPTRLSVETFNAAIDRLHNVASGQARSRAGAEEERQRLWRYGLFFVAAALVAEGLLGRKMG